MKLLFVLLSALRRKDNLGDWQIQYNFDSLPIYKWHWPTGTFLQRRLAELAREQVNED